MHGLPAMVSPSERALDVHVVGVRAGFADRMPGTADLKPFHCETPMTQRILLALATFVVAASAAAQQPVVVDNLPVAIVLVDAMPIENAKAIVIRRKTMVPENIVLVTKETVPVDLANAMAVLARSRKNKGDRVSDDMVAPIAPSKSAKRPKDYLQATKDLKDIRTAGARFIEGVGPAPVIFSHVRPPGVPKK